MFHVQSVEIRSQCRRAVKELRTGKRSGQCLNRIPNGRALAESRERQRRGLDAIRENCSSRIARCGNNTSD